MNLSTISKEIAEIFSGLGSADFYNRLLAVAVAVVLVLLSFKVLQIVLGRMMKGHVTDQQSAVVRKLIRYAGFTVAVMTIFNRLGIDLSALLGAAGIAGIAVGFAAQTSISNVISGLFLISEKPFQAGDVIQVGDVSGVVQSIDFLSIKIQTFDNRFVRIPNETIIKTNVINVTRFPIRRFDLWMTVPYGEDLERVKAILLELAAKNVYTLDNPEPLVVFDKFDTSGINILLGLWFEKTNFMNLKNSIMADIHTRFAQEGIKIPYPQMDVHLRES